MTSWFSCLRPRLRLIPALGVVGEQVSQAFPTRDRLTTHYLKARLLMGLTLTTTQQVHLRVTPTDHKGHPAPLDGPPSWTTSNTDLVALTPADAG